MRHITKAIVTLLVIPALTGCMDETNERPAVLGAEEIETKVHVLYEHECRFSPHDRLDGCFDVLDDGLLDAAARIRVEWGPMSVLQDPTDSSHVVILSQGEVDVPFVDGTVITGAPAIMRSTFDAGRSWEVRQVGLVGNPVGNPAGTIQNVQMIQANFDGSGTLHVLTQSYPTGLSVNGIGPSAGFSHVWYTRFDALGQRMHEPVLMEERDNLGIGPVQIMDGGRIVMQWGLAGISLRVVAQSIDGGDTWNMTALEGCSGMSWGAMRSYAVPKPGGQTATVECYWWQEAERKIHYEVDGNGTFHRTWDWPRSPCFGSTYIPGTPGLYASYALFAFTAENCNPGFFYRVTDGRPGTLSSIHASDHHRRDGDGGQPGDRFLHMNLDEGGLMHLFFAHLTPQRREHEQGLGDFHILQLIIDPAQDKLIGERLFHMTALTEHVENQHQRTLVHATTCHTTFWQDGGALACILHGRAHVAWLVPTTPQP